LFSDSCGFETEKVRGGAGWDGLRVGSGQNFSNYCGCGAGTGQKISTRAEL